jgi:hypothetical protein
LITIRKAEALIAAEREGPEIAALPAIVIRRRSPRHVYLAAGTLLRRLCEKGDRRRAVFYGEIAQAAAAELGDPISRASLLNHVGVTLVADCRFREGIETLDQGLAVLSVASEGQEHVESLRAVLLGNLGGAKVLHGEIQEGVRILEAVLPRLDEEYNLAEGCLDLCYGYMELQRYDVAEMYGRRALGQASVARQVRNANHLLGEICQRTGRVEESDAFFDVVASYYPDFKNVKQLLVAVDLCSVINWKG